MDHSLRSYLERRTTKELDWILRTHLQHWEEEYCADIVRMVLDILREREKDLYVDLPPELIAYYRQLMEK